MAMEGQGSILSCDIHPHKIELIAKGAKRLGFDIITAQLQDATAFCPQWQGRFDRVIADVPCSGLGIIRKKPDIRYKDLSAMAELPALQKKILLLRYYRDYSQAETAAVLGMTQVKISREEKKILRFLRGELIV